MTDEHRSYEADRVMANRSTLRLVTSRIRHHLDVREDAVVIARADRGLAVALAREQHDLGDMDRPRPSFLRLVT